MKLWKRLKVHKTSEIVWENAYGTVSRARWVISALVSDIYRSARSYVYGGDAGGIFVIRDLL